MFILYPLHHIISTDYNAETATILRDPSFLYFTTLKLYALPGRVVVNSEHRNNIVISWT